MKVVRIVALLVLILAACLLATLLAGPLLIPVPPLEGTVPPETLADPDSRFADVNGVRVHYKMAGSGEPALVLLHGFLASTYSWREVMAPLAQTHTVVAFDRPGFGLTQRPMPGEWTGENPYGPEAQATLAVGLMDKLGIKKAVLVGNSAGGTVSVLTALRYPDRVLALVLVDSAVYGGGGVPDWVRPLLTTPQAQRIGPVLVRSVASWGRDFGRSAWHDPGKLTPEIWAGYT
jgi:pimeloyl-ACP methyl ester carboxylesterase